MVSSIAVLAARGMRSRRINVIGLIMPDVSSPYCNEVMRGVNKVIAGLDYDLIIYTTGDVHKYHTADKERQYVTLLNGNITDGVIMVTPVATSFSTHAPVVEIDPNNESPECPGIIANNREGALTAMNYLTGLGHHRIGFITGRLELVSACQRLEGYKDGLCAAGIPYDGELVQVGDSPHGIPMSVWTRVSSPRCMTSQVWAPSISSQTRTQRAHRTQRLWSIPYRSWVTSTWCDGKT